ncbi:MAG: precorrin-2 C(20)-methyltransferase [Thermoplasmata archaeon]|nr:precorrin-2 C(20)-methyltransferase [Thermoplasmata archaeon]
MAGKLYGIGVGPGEPGLLTLKAKEILEGCGVIAYPVRKLGEGSTAFDIISQVVDVSEKSVEEFLFSMDPDDSVREKCREDAMNKMCRLLDNGEDIAMVTLGDVGVYSTYMYIDREIASRGYDTEVVPGIPSFCHGAALAGIPLMIGNEGLAVVPVAKENSKLLRQALESFDNVVVMKAFKSMSLIASTMEEFGIPLEGATVVSNVGMEGEYIGPIDLDRQYGYFTTVLIKKNKGGKDI